MSPQAIKVLKRNHTHHMPPPAPPPPVPPEAAMPPDPPNNPGPGWSRGPRNVRSRPELERFRQNLARAMEDRSLTASALAREIWGTTTDTRGYHVARNRDRITHYLAGTGYPLPRVLEKMAQVLGIDPAQLAKDESSMPSLPPAGESGERVAQRLGASINVLAPVGGVPLAQVTLHHPMPMEAAVKILEIYTAALKALDESKPPPPPPEGKE